jgi:hypothetical protein
MCPVGLAENLEKAEERIAQACARAGRRREEVTLVAVTKTFPAATIREAHALGVRHFGENRVQEWEGKHAEVAGLAGATWHLVGHLQSNKARRAAELFHTVDSVDSVALAERLDRIIGERGGTAALPILLEVRLAPEETKQGVEPEELPRVAEAVLRLVHVDLRGLMCVPPYFEDPEKVRPYFRRLRELRDALCARLSRGAGARHSSLATLSMGMSHDFEAAIEEGATEIRLGTVLFGARARP